MKVSNRAFELISKVLLVTLVSVLNLVLIREADYTGGPFPVSLNAPWNHFLSLPNTTFSQISTRVHTPYTAGSYTKLVSATSFLPMSLLPACL